MFLVFDLDLEEGLAPLAVVRLVRVVDAEHVLFEMRQLSEGLLAEFAGVRLLPRVHSEMQLEGRRVREGPGADFAAVRPLARVDPHVDRELGALVEPGAALVAPEGLLLLILGVGPHVVADVALEALATDVTLVEPLVLVEGENVALQGVGSRVGFLAQVTLELPGPYVKLHVGLEVPAGGELEVAIRAGVGLVPRVGTSVDHQLPATGEPLVTVLALVRPLPGVGSLVQPEPLLDGEPATALLTLVRHLTRVRPHVDGQAADLDELAAADPALVRLVPRVLAGVLLRVVLPGESLVAVGAVEAALLLSRGRVLDDGHGDVGLHVLVDLELGVDLVHALLQLLILRLFLLSYFLMLFLLFPLGSSSF